MAAPLNTVSTSSPAPLWQRIESLREVLTGSCVLLSEAGTLVRNAENSLAAGERQRLELEGLRIECDRLLGLSSSLEQEKLRLQEELCAAAEPARLALAGLESRVQALHSELEQTRLSLSEERERRSRAIHLIRPTSSHDS